MQLQSSKDGKKLLPNRNDESGEHDGLPAELRNEESPADQRSCDSTEPDDESFSSLSWDDTSPGEIQFRATNGLRYHSVSMGPDDTTPFSGPSSDEENQDLLADSSNSEPVEAPMVDKEWKDSNVVEDGFSPTSSHGSTASSNDISSNISSDGLYRKVDTIDPGVSGPIPVSSEPRSSAHNILWLVICFLGIMASFVSYGIVLEYATSDGRKLHELSFILVSSILGSLTAAAGRYVRREAPSTIPSNRFVVLGAMSIGSTFCAIRALRYVIFPIQVLARSAKPVPVMLMGTMMGKKYHLLKYMYVVLIVLGVAIFIGGGDILKHDDANDEDTSASTISSSSQHIAGILLLLTALFFDGTTGAYEDKLMSVHRVEPFDLMLNFQLSKTLLSGLALLLFGQMDEFVSMIRGTGFVIVVLGMCSAVGQVFIFVTISMFGALTCSLLSLTRKATTLAASIIIYDHPINAAQIVGICVGIGGMALNASNYGIHGDAAGNSAQSLHNRVLRRLTCSKRILLLSFVLVFVVAIGAASHFWPAEDQYDTIQIPIDDNAQPCTYDQLYDTFGSTPGISDEDQCWKLSDRIMRVSQDKILNFHSLIPLGHGNQSGVFKVFLELSNGEHCVAVYKTDLRNTGLCHDAWRHPSENWGHTKSCISAFMRPRKTTMPAEYTGALVWLAQREADLDLPGLVPTWAIVPEKLQSKNKPKFLRLRHSSERILGIIEPYIHMQRLIDVKAKVANSTTHVAKVVLPAAEGLAFINELGFAHQDVLIDGFKNVGFVDDENYGARAVVYDYGYIALDDGGNADCSLGRACDYCVEDFFPAPKMDDPIKYDLDNLRDITLELLKMSPDRVDAAILEKTLQKCATMSELVAALKHSL